MYPPPLPILPSFPFLSPFPNKSKTHLPPLPPLTLLFHPLPLLSSPLLTSPPPLTPPPSPLPLLLLLSLFPYQNVDSFSYEFEYVIQRCLFSPMYLYIYKYVCMYVQKVRQGKVDRWIGVFVPRHPSLPSLACT